VSQRRVEGERGAIAVLVAVFALVMFGLAAIVVDLGMARVTKADTRAAADAAALAGAAALYAEPNPAARIPDAVTAVKDSAVRNGTATSEWSGCTAPAPGPGWVRAGSGSGCILFDSASSPRRVFVAIPPRRVEPVFGGLLGYSGTDVSASAQAQARDRTMQDCSLCAGDLIDVSGRVRIDGDGSAVADRLLVRPGGELKLTAAAIGAGGGIGYETDPPSPRPPDPRYDPQPERQTTVDPFAAAARPGLPGNTTSSVTCGTGQSLQTGFAYRNVTVAGNCTISGSGTLFVTRRLRVTSTGTLTGTNSTVFITCRGGSPSRARYCDSSSSRGWLSVSSGGRLNLTGGSWTAGGRQLAIYYDPANTADMIVDGALTVTSGSVYKRTGDVEIDGATTVGGLMSVDDLDVDDVSDTLTVSATGLGSQPGPFRVALVK
jgi:hypothetical protein